MFRSVNNLIRETKDMERLLDPANKKSRRLIFYSERDIYFRYYEDYIDYILANSDLDITYISSQAEDPIFEQRNPRIKTYYLRNLLMGVMAKLDGGVFVMTMPDLGRRGIERAPHPVQHVYVFHGIASTHRGYLPGAFDNYDSILCIAQHQIDELRKTEEVYGLKPKNLILAGYPLAERINREYKTHLPGARTSRPLQNDPDPPMILVAPTWGPSSMLDACPKELIENLAKTTYKIIIRPHHEFIKRQPKKMKLVEQLVAKTKNISIQSKLDSLSVIHQCDLLITDHSSIVFEYVLGTERPALLIDTPAGRMENPEWTKIGMDVVELTCRDRLGLAIKPENMSNLASTIDQLLTNPTQFESTLLELRQELVANWQNSAAAGGEALINLCGS